MNTNPFQLAIQQFHTRLYREHLEDASFLYEQLQTLHESVAKGALSWERVSSFEDRLEAQLDALLVGDEWAWNVCQERAVKGDFGELYAAVCLACRRNSLHTPSWEAVKNWLLDLNPEQHRDYEARVQAIADALAQEMPDSWQSKLLEQAQVFDVRIHKVLAQICLIRGWEISDTLKSAILNANNVSEEVTLFQALGRLSDAKNQAFLLNRGFRSEHSAVREASSLALLRAGDLQQSRRLLQIAPQESWAWIQLGLSGGQVEANWLAHNLDAIPPSSSERFITLGLFGDVRFVPLLLKALTNTETAAHAALGLYLITGAPLFYESNNMEQDDEDEEENENQKVFDSASTNVDYDPIEALMTSLYQENSSEKAEAVKQEMRFVIPNLVQDVAIWQAWLQANAAMFQAGGRFRLGKPYSALNLIVSMLEEHTVGLVRQWMSEELVIRYAIPLPFHVDWNVQAQKLILLAMAMEAKQQYEHEKTGRYYVAGRLI